MKTSSTISLIIFLVLACGLSLKAQQDKYPETVIIKCVSTYEGSVMNEKSYSSKMIVITPENETEVKLLGKGKVLEEEELIKADLLKLKLELQKWHNLGFNVKSSDHVSHGIYLIQTIILQKN